MYIDTVKLTNFKRFESLELHFDEKINVFIGINGTGKTSVLQAITYALNPFLAHQHRLILTLPKGNELVHKRGERINYRVRLESVYPVDIMLLIKDGDTTIWADLGYKDENDWSGSHGTPQGSYRQKSEIGWTLPVFAFYEAGRFVVSAHSIDLRANLRPEERIQAYKNWNKASISDECAKTLSWIVTKTTERMQLAIESQTAFEAVSGDDLSILNQALGTAFEEFQSIYYDWKSKSVLTLWRGDRFKAFEDLSDGERGIILLFADIVRRVALLNPHLGDKAALETDGVVLIDEIDAHLHPSWQQKIVPGLNKAFPKIQFIVSTHSPFVVGEVKPSSLFILNEDEVRQPSQSYGLNNDEINLQLFQTVGQNKEVREQVKQIQNLIDAGKLNEARAGIASLEALLNGTSQDTRDLEMQLEWARMGQDV